MRLLPGYAVLETNEEGKTMGLAPYGSQEVYNKLKEKAQVL